MNAIVANTVSSVARYDPAGAARASSLASPATTAPVAAGMESTSCGVVVERRQPVDAREVLRAPVLLLPVRALALHLRRQQVALAGVLHEGDAVPATVRHPVDVDDDDGAGAPPLGEPRRQLRELRRDR